MGNNKLLQQIDKVNVKRLLVGYYNDTGAVMNQWFDDDIDQDECERQLDIIDEEYANQIVKEIYGE